MTRFHRGRSVPGHAPAQSENEADRSRATKTGQVDELATALHTPLIAGLLVMVARIPSRAR